MVKLTRDQLVKKLADQGLSLSRIELHCDSACTIEDALWNYRDLGHYNVVHSGAGSILYNPVQGDALSYLLFKSWLSLPLLIMANSYALDERTLLHFSAWLYFVIVVETRFEELPGGCRVTSGYDIAAPRAIRFLLPLVKLLLRRNHRALMQDDLPMRSRRAQLRQWGFRYDYDGAERLSEATLDLSGCHVVAPSGPCASASILVGGLSPQGGEAWVGRDDHLGLRLVRRESRLLIFPRLCRHEGASLDAAPCVGGAVSCPWHGRAQGPIAELPLDAGEEMTARTPWHRLSLSGGILRVSPTEDGRG